jgi:hypothetical protein
MLLETSTVFCISFSSNSAWELPDYLNAPLKELPEPPSGYFGTGPDRVHNR